jgi:hypothetical protein
LCPKFKKKKKQADASDEEGVGGMFPWSKITFPPKSKSLFFVPFIFFSKKKKKKKEEGRRRRRKEKSVENQAFCN